jgi:hypothetical protein
MLSISSIAQIDTLKVSKNTGFDVESGVKTGTIKIQDVDFDIFSTKKGSEYIKVTGKKGNVYPVWIGKSTGSDIFYDGGLHPCRISGTGKKFVIILVAGRPVCKYES